MIAKIKEITDVEGFKLNAESIVAILNVILGEIFGFILNKEYSEEA